MTPSTLKGLKIFMKGILFTSLLFLFYFLHMKHAIEQYRLGFLRFVELNHSPKSHPYSLDFQIIELTHSTILPLDY